MGGLFVSGAAIAAGFRDQPSVSAIGPIRCNPPITDYCSSGPPSLPAAPSYGFFFSAADLFAWLFPFAPLIGGLGCGRLTGRGV